MIFSAFKWLAIIWALVILYKRMKLIKASSTRKIVAFPFAAFLIIFYFGVNQYRTYIIDTYGRATNGMHGTSSTRHYTHGKTKKGRYGSFKTTSTYAKPNDTLFFTDRNPVAGKRGGMRGMMRRSTDPNAVPTRSFWLVTKRLNRPKCVKNIDGKFYVLNVDGELVKPKIQSKKGCTKITFEVPKSGYYTIYYIRNFDNIVNIAKYEYKRFNHGGNEEFTKEKIAPKTIKQATIDIIRLRDNEDSFYYSLHSGDELRFEVQKDGKALQGARVTLKTQFGWQKSVRTDKNGIAKFRLIQDYNPKWEKFNKRFREKFLVTATYKDKNDMYKVSYTAVYRPAREAYQSYVYALFVSIVLLIVLSITVFIYRYRVQKPFKEVTFDE